MKKFKRTKYGDYERRVFFPIFSDYELHVVFTQNIVESRKARYGCSGASGDAGAMHSMAAGGHAHLFFKIGNSPSGIIAHECWHAIYGLMKEWAGVDHFDNETIAYHLGYLVQKVNDFRNDLIDANLIPYDWGNRLAQKQSQVLSKIQ